MSELDVMALLAAANPVGARDLLAADLTADSILSRRRRPDARLVLVAVVLLAAAASLIGVFAFRGAGHRSPPLRFGDTLFTPTLARPIPGSEVTLAAASAAIGQPIVLPDTSLVGPADVGSAWVSGAFPNVTAAVTFPSAGVFVDYTAPPPSSDPSATYQAIARENPHIFEAIELNGGTALAVRQNADDTGHNFGGVVFVLDGLEIDVSGHYDEAALQSIAQSIVDQESASSEPLGVGSPPNLVHPLGGGKLVTLADATRAFGGKIVQPDTTVVRAADAGSIWVAGNAQVANVAITYPRADLWVDYTWPTSYDGGYDDQLLRYHAHSRLTHVALLDGVPAQIVFHDWRRPRWSGFYPSVHFDAGGVNVSLWGHQDEATLEDVARSIVARSTSPPAGQLGDVGGVQLYPYLGDGRRISRAEASATLGSRVVLPASSLVPTDGAQAWAEGTCPQPGAPNTTMEVCGVWISFPGSRLSVGYIRPPAYLYTGPETRLQARGLGKGGRAIHVGGRPALLIHPVRRGYPERLEFDLDGIRIVVAGGYSPAKLQAVAKSIVARSGS